MSKRSLDIAINEACKATGSYRLGAVIFKGSNIILSGYNNGYDHAEMRVLNRYTKQNNKTCNFLVIRIRKDGTIGGSRPCMHCLNLLKRTRNKIDKIYYSNDDGEIIMEKLEDMESTYVTRGHSSGGIPSVGVCVSLFD